MMSAPEIHNAGPEGDLKPVRVQVRQLDYITKGINPLGDEVDKMATAYGPGDARLDPSLRLDIDPQSQEFADLTSDFRLGQLIMVRPQAYIGLITSGAVRDITTDDAGEEVEPEEELLDSLTATVEQLADWIRDERPTVQDVVSASGGNP